MTEAAVLQKPRPRQKKSEQPENSIALRILCCLMAVLCLAAACVYVSEPSYLTFIYLWGALSGSYISYNFRHSRSIWLTSITVILLLVVLGNFIQEVVSQIMSPHLDPLVPFIHVLTGLLALHTFDLRTRTDININVLIGIGLLSCAMVLGRDLFFGLIVITYILLGGLLLYYECTARTRSSGRYAPSEASTYQGGRAYRESRGNALSAIMTLPILSILFFFTLPRIDSLFDFLFDSINGSQAPPIPASEQGKGAPGTALRPGGSGTGGMGGVDGKGNGAPDGAKATGAGPLSGLKGTPEEIAEQLNLTGKDPNLKTKKKVSTKKSDTEEPSENELVFHNKSNARIDDEVVMEVQTTGDFYYRRMVFDKYDGHKWTVGNRGMLSKCRKLSQSAYQELGGVNSLFLPLKFQSQEVFQDIHIRMPLGHYIPIVSIPQRIDFPADPIIVDDFGTLSAPSMLKDGIHYRVISQVPVYKIEEMRTAPEDKEAQDKLQKEMESYLQLPKELPEEVKNLAKETAQTDGNWFVKAERICKYLRSNYKYEDDLREAPKDKDLVDDFLFSDEKQGACGPFSSAFVVMCRAAGIPAREVGGYSPGEYNGVTGYYEIRGRNGHAWGEAYIPNSGWVPFDATPTGQLPVPQEEEKSILSQIKKNLQQLEKTINPPRPKKSTAQNANQASSASGTSRGQGQPQDGNGTPGSGPGGQGTGKTTVPAKPYQGIDIFKKIPFTWQAALLSLAVIPLTVLLIQCFMQLIKWFKEEFIKSHPKDAKSSTMLYLKVVDDLRELKISRQPSDTADDLSKRFFHALDLGMDVHPELPQAFQRFMEIYCDDRFGNDISRGRELEELGGKIHTFVRKYHPDKQGK
jgi:transglutaminase-like putative cysteine protease